MFSDSKSKMQYLKDQIIEKKGVMINDNDEYLKFLSFYKNFYKYSLHEALSIYVQNEKATACADFATWKMLSQSIIQGEKALYVFDYNEPNKKINLFDISQTWGTFDIDNVRWKYDKKYNIITDEITNKHLSTVIEKIDWHNVKTNADVFINFLAKSSEYVVRNRLDLQETKFTFDNGILENDFDIALEGITHISYKSLEEISHKIKNNELDLKIDNNSKEEKTAKTKEVEQFSFFENETQVNTSHNSFDELKTTNVTKNNFVKNDFSISHGKKAKINDNINAIELLKKLKSENKLATTSEQEVLAKYHGFGGLSEVFDPKNESYTLEKEKLKKLLTTEEYEKAEASVLNAHYTNSDIINSMYKAIGGFGFTGGKILEPSMGVGNFYSLLPKELQSSTQLSGVELDNISGEIASQLFQKANIKISGFEDTNFKNDTFDLVIGNVPFGDYSVYDKDYSKYNLLVHDYFIVKAIDKTKDNGIVAIVTSKGTLDKTNNKTRKLISEKANLLGAIRLPSNAFKETAHTEVITDILFFQKTNNPELNPTWLYTSEVEIGDNNFSINNYYIENRNMILGELRSKSGRFGHELDVTLDEEEKLSNLLENAINNLPKDILNNQTHLFEEKEENRGIDNIDINSIKNFSYEVISGKAYIRNNDELILQKHSGKQLKILEELIQIRKQVRKILDIQVNNCSDNELIYEQNKLNDIYDSFIKKHGYINQKSNKKVFENDIDLQLVLAIENITKVNNVDCYEKAKIFTERTIKQVEVVEKVETIYEALTLSLNEKGNVDVPYIEKLLDKGREYVLKELDPFTFKNPLYEINGLENNTLGLETKEQYLSGNVRKKLELAKGLAQNDNTYIKNVESLEKIQPEWLYHHDIDVQLGTSWIPKKYIEDFMMEKFKLSPYNRDKIKVEYSNATGEWRVQGYGSTFEINQSFGTNRINGYGILMNSLNLKKVKIYDYNVENGKRKAVLNEKETKIAKNKQEILEKEFKNWIYVDKGRRTVLENIYNNNFNNTVLRKYDGSHLDLKGKTNSIELRPHQKNAVYRILSNGNTLLHHEVGSGKTFTITASCMEAKRLGLANKSMIVVPNHLVDQWSSEFLKLYPNANILAITPSDFSKENRKLFISKIATGNYDTIIISHSSFGKIPVSKEYRTSVLNSEIETIKEYLLELDEDNFSFKQLQKVLKTKESQLKKLNNESDKDKVVDFEELGVNYLYVDEAHEFKNLFIHTKLSGVAGVQTAHSQKATDMYLKTMYINKINKDNRGVIFATGTPVSNTLAEVYTMQRYLMNDELNQKGLNHHDNWVANFGEISSKAELAPSGQGLVYRERLASFKNIPELMKDYQKIADIVTNDMINLKLPNLKNNEITIVSAKPSDDLLDYTNQLVERSKKIKDGLVPSYEDNMLVVTNDGRKAGLDLRLIDDLMPDYSFSKVNLCVENVFKVWEDNKETKATQLVFCDLSTPTTNSQAIEQPKSFNVYNDIKTKLVNLGVPIEEIRYIHDCKNNDQKAKLFEEVRNGSVRVLLGSTKKCGAGTNVQDKLIAIHDLDCPWKPSDLEQRLGRIVRQGNQNKEVEVYRYVTEKSFDAYLWNIIETKAKFISQIMNGDTSIRRMDDDNDVVLSYGEIKSIATGNPLIKKKFELTTELNKLMFAKSEFNKNKSILEKQIVKVPEVINNKKKYIENLEKDIEYCKNHKNSQPIKINGNTFDDLKTCGEFLNEKATLMNVNKVIGEVFNFKIIYKGYDSFLDKKQIELRGNTSHIVELSKVPKLSCDRILETINSLGNTKNIAVSSITDKEKELESIKNELDKEFMGDKEIDKIKKELNDIDIILNEDSAKEKEIDRVEENER